MIILVAAVANNWAIGKNNQMLWHLPNDFKHFKNITTNQTIVMGRKTFESLPGVLPNRKHVIITRNKNYNVPENCFTEPNIDAVIKKYNHTDIYVIGGGEIYKQTLPVANKIELTIVNDTFKDADTFFPEIDFNEWKIVHKENREKDEKHKYSYQFLTLIRKSLG